jgi:hypothetical protein
MEDTWYKYDYNNFFEQIQLGTKKCRFVWATSVFFWSSWTNLQNYIFWSFQNYFAMDKIIWGRENEKNCNGSNGPFNWLNHAWISGIVTWKVKRKITGALGHLIIVTLHACLWPEMPQPQMHVCV